MVLSTAEIERELRYEIKSKRQAASGAFHKRGKGVKHGFSGAIRTPYTMLTGKAKREYIKPGEVHSYNMYKSLMTYMELQTHPEDRQKEILKNWRKFHQAQEIQEALGVDKNKYYDMLYQFEILPRPASWKPAGEKRWSRKDKIEPKAEDIVSFDELMAMDYADRLETLDEYNNKYILKSVAAIWGKTVNRIYSMRYDLRQKLGLPNVNKTKSVEKSNNSVDNVEKHKQQVLTIEPEKVVEKNDIPDIQLKEIPEKENDAQEVEETIMEAVKERDEITGMNRAELEQLKQLVLAQSQVIQEIVESQKQQVQLAAVGGIPVHEEVQEVPIYQEETEEPKKGMVFQFEDVKEGFMLHNDLERFISVLKKNPDQFQVDIKITRIDE